jgi:hypothetical protein
MGRAGVQNHVKSMDKGNANKLENRKHVPGVVSWCLEMEMAEGNLGTALANL